MEYTEHEKLTKVMEANNHIVEFLEWAETKNVFLAKMDSPTFRLTPVKSISLLLSEYNNIDMKKLDEEHKHMINELKK